MGNAHQDVVQTDGRSEIAGRPQMLSSTLVQLLQWVLRHAQVSGLA